MLTYSFVDKGPDSLYQHLYKCIKNDIITGVLAPGEKLPSKRSFAKNLNISTITIENAYAQLIAEGYLYTIPKKGYYVAELSNQVLSQKVSDTENLPLPASHPAYFADFTSNQTNPDNFPFSIWTKLLREVIAENSKELMMNSPSGGILPLRQAIANHLQDFRGMQVSPQQIIVGAGTEYLYGLLIQLLGYDCCYAVENPGYRKVAQIYASNQVDCVYIDMDKNGICIPQLEASGADIVHISPSHHFPTGLITPVSRRYELLGWAAAKDSRYIIEDDYDCEFRLMGKPIPSLQSIDVMEKVIYINTFSKSLSSTIRISYMVLPKHLLNRFYEKLDFYSCTVSNFEQYTLARFIRDGYFEKHINRMRNFYRIQRDTLLSCIEKSPNASLFTITEENAGLHFLLHIHTDLSDDQVLHKAEQSGIRLSCLSQYYHGEDSTKHTSTHTFIINYSGIAPERIEEAVARLASCLKS